MANPQPAFGHLIHFLVVRNCQQRGTRYRVWYGNQLVGEFARRADAERSARAVQGCQRGQANIEQLW